jgi:hypothetical protein
VSPPWPHTSEWVSSIARSVPCSERDHVVERDHSRLAGDPTREPAHLWNDPTVLQDHQGGISLAVVLPVEQQDLLATGHLAGDADHLSVRLRRGGGELPLRQPVTCRQVLRDGDRILCREQELVPARHLGAHGLHDRGRRVPAKGAHVGDVHVQVLVPVHIGEVGALAVGDPDRGVLVEIVHP